MRRVLSAAKVLILDKKKHRISFHLKLGKFHSRLISNLLHRRVNVTFTNTFRFTTKAGSFHIFEMIFFFCFVVAMSDLGHNVYAIYLIY